MPHCFAEKLHYLRLQHGVSQSELARRCGLASHSHVNNLEANRRAPSLDLVVRLAALFGITTDYLLRDTISVEEVTAHAASVPSPIAPTGQPACHLFRQKLRRLRKQRKLTQVQLSQQLALRTQAHISLLESGRSEPSPEFVLQLADFFTVSTEYLLNDAIPIE